MLEQFGDVETAYGMSQEELCAKIGSCDALIVRSATKVCFLLFLLFFQEGGMGDGCTMIVGALCIWVVYYM